MPYLNWRDLGEQELQKSVAAAPGPHARSPEVVTLTLSLDGERHQALCELLSEVLASQAEARIEMPGEWRVFFKLREGESRVLVAHPELDQWVTTAMLTANDTQVFLDALRAPGFKKERLSEKLRLSGTSNGDLVVRFLTRETILVVEDTSAMREMLLQLAGGLRGSVRATGVANGAQLRTEVRKNRPTWVILDEVLPGESAAELGAFLAEEGIPYALVSATGTREAPLPPGCQVRLQKPDWNSLEQTATEWAKWWEQARG